MEHASTGTDKAAQFRLLTEVTAGTPMGTLLRSFWQPVADATRLKPGGTLPVTVMGEDLTLYRGESGKPYLVGGRCAHRCTVMHTGLVREEQISCMYHGWRYDGTGQCTAMPAEKRGARPDLVKIAGYPVHEYGTLLFAYMGEGEPPPFDLPRKDILEDPKRHLFLFHEIWDCHWLQQIENSLDAAHVSFAHVWGRMSRFGEEITTSAPDLSYTETSAGILQVATRSAKNVRKSDWTFPNNNHVVVPGPKKGDPWSHVVVWGVPIDETRTLRFTLISSEPGDDALEREIKRDYQPAEHQRELFMERSIPPLGSTQFLSVQDYVAVRGQGVIVDRSQEHLAQTDMGIVLLRRILMRELECIQQGRPTKSWTKLAVSEPMPISVPEPAPAPA